MFLNYFDIYQEVIHKSFSVTSPTLTLILISLLSLFECITRSSSLTLEELLLQKLPTLAGWFIIILFVMLRRFINFFILFSYSKSISYIFNYIGIYFFSQSKMISYSFTYVFLYFFPYSRLKFSSIYVLKKKYTP